jgi:hypothetical protein
MINNKYFEKFSTVEFNGVLTRDFINWYDVVGLAERGDFFMNYIIENGENLDTIAYKLYGNTSYYWIILLLNNIQDAFYDLPLSEDEIKKVVLQKIEAEGKDISEFYKYYNEESERNNKKKYVRVVSPDKIKQFISMLIHA